MTTEKKGGCLCGAVRYTLQGEPQTTAACHCTHCQRQSGSVLSFNAIVTKDQLQITCGQPKQFADVGDSGKPVLRYFCGDCGSPIYSEIMAMSGILAVKCGSLDDPGAFRPTLEVYARHAAPWMPVLVSGQRHDGVPQ